ncbi:MAG: hypothetical protein WC967_14130 [Balneolaceae bacterium]
MNSNKTEKGTASPLFSALVLGCLFIMTLVPSVTFAQSNELRFEERVQSPSPKGALLRSLVMPGWGHNYVDSNNWTRGKIHLAADVIMILSYVGLNNRVNTLEGNLVTQANARAGINLSGQSRQVELAVSKFNSIEEYNDYQLRSRNWDKLIPQNSQTSWSWDSAQDRYDFQNTRERISTASNQLPALLTLMVANRVLSGINAFTRARNMQVIPQASISYLNEFGEPGLTARVVVGF